MIYDEPVTLPEIQLLRAGDEPAWSAAFERLWPVAVKVAQGKLRPMDLQEAEDVAAESLQNLVSQVHQVETSEELLPLLVAITHNNAMDQLRRALAQKRSINQTFSLELLHDVKDDADSPLGRLVHAEFVALMARLLQTQTSRNACVLYDFFFNRLSYKELAKKYGMKTGTIGVVLKRSLKSIREIIQENPVLMKEIQAELRYS